MENIESLTKDLPDPAAAERFYNEFASRYPGNLKLAKRTPGLLSDLLAISSYSPLIATTLLQNPDYVSWLDRQRNLHGVKTKEELLESLAQFALTNSTIEPNVMLSRFRRRELIRIYLKDIRRLNTVAEITEEISNLADVILEYALRIAQQELDNRYGMPLETDENSRGARASFSVVALGKLGSRELNYSSDIDLLFVFSNNGMTAGAADRESISNKQYFNKLAERISKIVSDQAGEGAAYRVDTRLRPYGSVGALAVTADDMLRYYRSTARAWEKQVLIRARTAAGVEQLFNKFYDSVLNLVYSQDETVADALENVRLSKEKINFERSKQIGFDVKLGRGGIREIEFIAQALQIAFGGKDSWLRASHTLISLSRLADRRLITELELTDLFEAYDFLRRLEHHLQMENGLQTHLVPDDQSKREQIARKMGWQNLDEFNLDLERHTGNVNRAFVRIFGSKTNESAYKSHADFPKQTVSPSARLANISPILTSIEKSSAGNLVKEKELSNIERFALVAPTFANNLAANPELIKSLPNESDDFIIPDFRKKFEEAVKNETSFAARISAMRKFHSKFLANIMAFDVYQRFDLPTLKRLQTSLAEASIHAALIVTKLKMFSDFAPNPSSMNLGVLGLGKLGSGGMDYNSDLDLVLIFDDSAEAPVSDMTRQQFYSKAAEIFVNALSSVTRDGSLYRVDLRLRPDGKNGATAIGKEALKSYLETRSAIWEWLAYVKLRGLDPLAIDAEAAAREIIHQAALNENPEKLRAETRRIRALLESEKSKDMRTRGIDIKYGEGGLQDVYFALRFLQLRDNLPDSNDDRSTEATLRRLLKSGSISEPDFANLLQGYNFLSLLDHQLRLSLGRSTILPLAKKNTLAILAERMNFASPELLLEELTRHRLGINESFENITN